MERQPKNGIDTQLITGAAELESLRAEWELLWGRTAFTTPFQSPEWLIPWCQIIGENDFTLLAMRRHGRRVALFPWMLACESSESVRRIRFLGAGVSDYHDALIENGIEAEAWQCALAWLKALRGRWMCQLEQLPVFSPLVDLLLPSDWQEVLAPQDYCPVLSLNRAAAVTCLLSTYGNLLDRSCSVAEFCRLWRALREHARGFFPGIPRRIGQRSWSAMR